MRFLVLGLDGTFLLFRYSFWDIGGSLYRNNTHFTNLKFLRNPWSEQRIETAMAKALEKMETVEVKQKISTVNNLNSL